MSNHDHGSTETQLGGLVVRHSLDAILLTAPNGGILLANKAACDLFGYTHAELIAGGLELLADRSDPEVAALIDAHTKYGFARGEQWMRRKDGNLLRVEVTSTAFESKGEQRVAIIVRDVSWHRQYEYQQRLIEAAVADIALIVCVVDQHWRMLWANRGTELISGYSQHELIGNIAPLRRHLEAGDPQTLATIEKELEAVGKWSGEVVARRRSGEIYPLHGAITTVETPTPGQYHLIAVFADNSKARENERKLHHISLYDPVTKLPNRTYFDQRVHETLERVNLKALRHYLMLIDIDDFGAINEALGYVAADRVLTCAAERLLEVADEQCILARHTGDSFALLIAGVDNAEEVAIITARIRSALQEPMEVNGHRFTLTAALGVSCYPEDGTTLDRLEQAAEAALQQVKDQGGDDYAFYYQGSEERSRRYIEFAAPMYEALANDEFVAHFQPIVESTDGRVVSMETLARWRRRDGKIVSPAEFIPVAERSGMIGEITESLLHQACRHLRVLDEAGHPGLHTSINLSARQFRDPELAARIMEIVSRERIQPDRICLEITESLIMDRPDEKSRVLHTLQAQGMKVVIDDFGTGYSSFAYLKHFHVNGIKLDRLFVRDVPGDRKDEALVSMMLAVGKKLDIPVVGEGVETRAQAGFLRERGCDRLQGYLIAPPLSADDFLTLLRNSSSSADRPHAVSPARPARAIWE